MQSLGTELNLYGLGFEKASGRGALLLATLATVFRHSGSRASEPIVRISDVSWRSLSLRPTARRR